jgi:hypothetical protein
VNAVVLDRETEEFDYVNRSIAGLPDLIDGKGAMLSAFTGIPPMLILGADPKGFSTGAEIIKAYNTTVQAWQVDKLEEPLQRLTKILLAVLDREVGDFTIHFHPLRTPDPKEVAELRAAIWGAARMLAEKGLITRDEFRALLRDPTDPAPTIQLSEEGSAVEASALQVGQVQALQNLILAAYPEGADPDVYRAAVEGALPQLSALVMRLFPDPPAADEETDEASERWVSAEEVANEFGSVTKGQLKRVRASAPKVEEPGRLTWTRPGSKPLYRLSEVRAMFDVAGPDLTVGTADDPGSSLHKEDNADDPDPSLADPR